MIHGKPIVIGLEGTPVGGKQLSSSAMMVTPDLAVEPDGPSCLWAKANEPPAGVPANATAVVFTKAADIVRGAKKSMRTLTIALYATRDVEPGEEITFVYSPLAGDEYADWRRKMKYNVGAPAPILKASSITKDELPASHLGDAAPKGAFFYAVDLE